MKELGRNQRYALQTLLDRHGWSPGCGWVWGTRSATICLLDSLVKRGLAIVTQPLNWRNGHVEYQITEAGRQQVFKQSTWHRLKYEKI